MIIIGQTMGRARSFKAFVFPFVSFFNPMPPFCLSFS